MKTKLTGLVFLSCCFIASPIAFASQTLSTQGQSSNGCQPSCAGIPKGQCSCVTTNHIKCCGKKTDGLTSKPATND
ncbi:hypothetical protein Lqui_1782 [Legionella quinlivanii]|uniref:Secreted protein n=1 Tax=Legionella quinlivanii TaxID=45073 RepID=A0A0W0Y0Q1_9GAMM|nr:hypothetical protein [Legionella quinlivanii]KTD50457.1 hypothetical protein Lqui_1782 [Legionella quinlivanii]SEF39782.1 hypothetical protein SAMN02746093_00041 [Legionella quinlivanii DSM 21216]STY12057.1 Uncharacterised protein [Legionella quinlivanii]